MATVDFTGTKRLGVLTKDKRRELLGLECVDQLEWRKWQPGTEYVKYLNLKNVSTSNAITITYKQTASKAFSMDFPEPVKIRPGMSTSLKVCFRPRKMQQYSDHIEIVCNDSSFIVMFEAFLPAVHIEVPSHLDFSFVPTKELVKMMLPVKNTGDLPVEVTWKLEAPFSIEPSSSTMGAGEVAVFVVTFEPPEACSYNVDAVCKLDSGESALVQISGIGKYPYLSIEHSSVDFGNVLVGHTVERVFRFGNHSVVNANFTVVHAEGPDDKVYTVTPTKGTLGPDEYTAMKVVYKPRHTGTFSSENFTISTAGGNKLNLNLRGHAIAPSVTFSARCFNFGNVPCGNEPTRTLYIQNASDIPVSYDFQLDPNDTFAISAPRGIIPGQTTSNVVITLRAGSPALYWKRVVCLIKDADPIGLDLLATCYDEKSRPPPFTPRHISNYLNRVTNGGPAVEQDPGVVSVPASPVLSHYGGSRPGSRENGLPGGDPASYILGASPAPPLPGATTLLEPLPETALNLEGPDGWDLLFDGQDPGKAVTMDVSLLDFGTCSKLSPSDYRSVVVTNHTSVKITAFFTIPAWRDPLTGEAKRVFQVFPESADLKPASQATFRIAFRPPRDAQHYAQTLQLCAFAKSMRSFRLVGSDSLVVPPWTLPLLTSGNTFLHTNPEYSPKVETTHSRIAFPPCRPGDKVCQTTMLVNYGDTPCAFSFAQIKAPFQVQPPQGVVPPKGHVLLGFRFTPTDASPVSARARCLLNGVAATALEITLSGAAYVPKLTFDVAGPLFFRPTCVGASSQRKLTMHNPSRVPVGFVWKVPSKLKNVIHVSPMTGALRGNESMQVTWSFAPAEQRTYDYRIPCLMLNPGEASPNSRAQTPGDRTIDNGANERITSLILDPALVAEALGEVETGGGSENGLDDDGAEIDIVGGRAQEGRPAREKVALHLVGEGTGGAMALDPPSLDLSTVRVGHQISRTVTLSNQSDGVLRYHLECAPAEDDGYPEPGATPVEFIEHSVDAVAVVKPGVEMWVDEAEGALPARASKTVTVTFLPRFRKNYKLQLLCRTATVAPQAPAPQANASTPGNGNMALPPVRPPSGGLGAPRLPPIQGLSKPGVLGVPSASLSNGGLTAEDSARDMHTTVVEPATLTTACPLTASATFPALLLTDAFIESHPKQVVWDMIGAKDFNVDLAANVTQTELKLNKMEDKGTLTTEIAMTSLAPHNFNFGVHGLGDRPVALMVELSNATVLPVKWVLASTDNPDLELENWVEPGQPRNAEEKARDFIVENRIFDATPRKGELEASGRCTITFAYTPHFLGSHELPMFLHMTDGKRLHIQLRGVTVQPPVQCLKLLPAYRQYTFDPVPIGEPQPPIQTYMLRNGGPGEVSFTCDLEPLSRLASSHWNYPVIQLQSEPSGTIPVGGAAPLNWLFAPVEAIHYAVDIPIHLGDGSVEVITLQGRGFHPDSPSEPKPVEDEGGRDWARWTGFGGNPATGLSSRLAVASHDMLSMGTSLFKGITRRVLVLSNKSVYPLQFSWDMGLFQPRHSSANALKTGLSILPSNGSLPPGEQVVVRFVMEAGFTPQLYESEVSCQVSVDEEEMFNSAEEVVKAAGEGDGAVDYTDTGSVIEEVIYEHPARSKPRTGREERLKNRLPIHLYMTTAIRTRISALNDQYMNTLERMTQRTMALSRPPELPAPQVVTVTLSGRVLAPNHIKSGYFIPPHELEPSRELLSGASWVPPLADPFWSGAASSLRDSQAKEAAVAAAAAAEAAAEEAEGVAQEQAQIAAEAEAAERQRAEAQEATEARGGDEEAELEAPAEAGFSDEQGVAVAEEEEGPDENVVSYTVVDQDAEGGEAEAEAEEDIVDVTFSGAEGTQALAKAFPDEVQEDEEAGVDSMPAAEAAEVVEAAEAADTADAADAAEAAATEDAPRPHEEEFSHAWKPLPRPPIIRPPSPALPSAQQSTAAAVTAVLRELLTNVVDPEHDPVVLDTLDTLKPDVIPAFAQLSSKLPEQYQVEPAVAGPTKVESQAQEEDPEAAQQAAVLQDPIFKLFAEFVVESAILGLVQESAEGEWDPPAAPEDLQPPEADETVAED